MTIDWQKEVEARKDDLLRDLGDLIRINSVRDVEHGTKEEPLGPGPSKALYEMLDIAKRDGFETKNVANVAGHIDYGEGDDMVGLLGHVDVVPVDDNWDTDPFEPVIKDGKLYARGSSDDKGPLMASYYAMKIIRDLKLPISKKIRIIIGTDEESEWYGIHRYMETEEMPKFGFSPDANFPIINGEKGILSYVVTFADKAADNGDFDLVSMKSGLRTNMVPGDATAVLKVNEGNVADMKAAFEKFIADNSLKGEFKEEGGNVTITVIGKGAHAQEPKFGVNSATFLADFLKGYKLDSNGQNYINTIANYMHLDYTGKKLGAYHKHDVMGESTASANLFDYTNDGVKNITINVRHPEGITKDEIMDNMVGILKDADVSIEIVGDIKTPHYVPGDDPLVQTLLAVYEDHTGEKGHEMTIGGGTYGRILERGVAYGAMFPGEENVMHQPNEYMPIDSLLKATAIYADAIYRLAK
ncbi:dipeptidase PepV [Enterococcus sp. ALS3]|uniref:Dipeptidase PepV n=1 Tax=Enterococcus alishanensis TaxID=1303817 RepID=A0ABS6TCU4_9ENTE|nr:dipeptidase PepV [Enterococcus alishanensis]MBV7390702.1 dipeptidase PepV [Enterococcus alishanensis]